MSDEGHVSVKSIEDYTVGESANIIHRITEEDVNTFARLTGDFNPLHLDKKFADKTSFGKPVVFGMLSASFISTIIGMKIPGPGALWTSQTLEFLHQVYVGDELEIQATVRQISIATKSLIIDIEICNQNGIKVLQGQATAKVLELREQKVGDELQSKGVVLITGGNSGMGAAIAKRLAKMDYKVAINYHNSKEKALSLLGEIENEGGIAAAYCADVSDADSVNIIIQRIQEELGSITSFIHCAAPENEPKSFDDLTWEDIQRHMNVQVKGAFNCCKKIVNQMAEADVKGKIIMIGSIYADNVPPLYQTDYIMAKAALSALARSMAAEYGSKGIAVNIISPGMTITDRTSNVPEKAKLLAKMQAPSRSLQSVEDVANIAAFLIEQKNCAITGETIRVCGGSVML